MAFLGGILNKGPVGSATKVLSKLPGVKKAPVLGGMLKKAQAGPGIGPTQPQRTVANNINLARSQGMMQPQGQGPIRTPQNNINLRRSLEMQQQDQMQPQMQQEPVGMMQPQDQAMPLENLAQQMQQPMYGQGNFGNWMQQQGGNTGIAGGMRRPLGIGPRMNRMIPQQDWRSAAIY